MDPGSAGRSSVPLVYLVRHGETAWSLSGQHTGRTDLPLTAHGEDQARALRPTLHDVRFDHVLTSPLERAQRTCALSGPLSGVATVAEIDPDLAEWDYGDYEGMLSRDIRRQRPGWNCYRDGCPGGESPDGIGQRADRLIRRIGLLQGSIALFTHGEFGCGLAARWIGLPVLQGEHFELATASVSILGFNPSHPGLAVIAQWNLVPGRLNDVQHSRSAAAVVS